MLNQKTSIYCVIGDPVKHSLSPLMHNALFKSLGLNAVYSRFHVKKEELKDAISLFRKFGIKGINVTTPHKTEIIKYLDEIDKTAKLVGAVNTIVNKNGKLIGYNTDFYGVESLLGPFFSKLKNKTAIILGAGGVARAVAFVLAKNGLDFIILNRTTKNAEKLVDIIKKRKKVKIQVYPLNNASLSKHLAFASLLCNCTSVGLHNKDSQVPKNLLHNNLVVFDAVYSKNGTALINNAKERGCKTIDGKQLLVEQGAKSFEIWTGKGSNKKNMFNAIIKGQVKGNIYLAGFMGSGKTSVGIKLSKRLHRKFVDVDEEIAKKAKKPIAQIFFDDGENKFRKYEEKMINQVSKKSSQVVALGGGVVTNLINTLKMKTTGTIISLKASSESIIKRTDKNNMRPLLNGLTKKQKLKKIKQLLLERKLFYQFAKDFEVTTDNKTIKEIVEEIIGELNE